MLTEGTWSAGSRYPIPVQSGDRGMRRQQSAPNYTCVYRAAKGAEKGAIVSPAKCDHMMRSLGPTRLEEGGTDAVGVAIKWVFDGHAHECWRHWSAT